jgi:hypothetical protein
MATTNRRNLVLWVRLDGNGDVIPGSEQYRPRGVKPRDGNWRQSISSYCCSCYCIITFQNPNDSTNSVKSITTPDGLINWTGELLQNETISFVIPSCYDETFTLDFGTVTGSTNIMASTVQGDGSITVDNDVITSLVTTTHISTINSTSATACSQYFVYILGVF